ncbi:hypothetical protein V502_03418 [Pseudogymnoascus sp. VKM F-4520 (FW-2644)]|nr:hypothetical protein V502_03418 [Pseudogymnoascus sp. VKM F-4520 (FW-2644)]
MSDDDQPQRSRGSLEFVETSIIQTIVPEFTELSLEEGLRTSLAKNGDVEAALQDMALRQTVFFDEILNVYVVLQTPHLDERAVHRYLDRLVVTLDANVVNALTDAQGQSGHELIYSGSNDQLKDAPVIIKSPGEDDKTSLLVVWKFPVPLTRPGRLRLQSPSVVFSISANLKTAEQLQAMIRQNEYLPSQMPSGINLFESFNGDPALGDAIPRLSALRVSRVKPVSPGEADYLSPLRIAPARPLKILPAFQLRARYARPNNTHSNPCIFASLDIEATPWAGTSLSLSSVEFKLIDGDVEDLNTAPDMALPMDCLPKDDITLVYRLSRTPLEQTSSPIKPLNITVTGTVCVSPSCLPKITMIWATSVDFTPPVNPGFGNPSATIQRDHRPAQLSISSNHEALNTSLAASRPDALPAIEFTTKHQRSLSVPDFGVTMTFTAPTTPIYQGDFFTWTVFVVNRSDHPRKLALIPIAKRRTQSSHNRAPTNRPLSSSYTQQKGASGGANVDIADAVLDENILYAAQKGAGIDTERMSHDRTAVYGAPDRGAGSGGGASGGFGDTGACRHQGSAECSGFWG